MPQLPNYKRGEGKTEIIFTEVVQYRCSRKSVIIKMFYYFYSIFKCFTLAEETHGNSATNTTPLLSQTNGHAEHIQHLQTQKPKKLSLSTQLKLLEQEQHRLEAEIHTLLLACSDVTRRKRNIEIRARNKFVDIFPSEREAADACTTVEREYKDVLTRLLQANADANSVLTEMMRIRRERVGTCFWG